MNFLGWDTRPQGPVAQTAFHQWASPNGVLGAIFYRQATGFLVRFPELADFEVSADGHRILGRPVPGVPLATTQHLYLNQVLPLALSRQGKLVLHGSAVEIGEQAVAFIGASGRGKSTLAASFAATGMRFLTDDALVLQWTGDELMAVPSHPSIRLWEDSQEALASNGFDVAPAVDCTSKARLLAGPALPHCDLARPLRHLYFLGEGRAFAPTIEPIKPAAALMQMVRNSFLLDIDESQVLAGHFEDISRIAKVAMHYQLDYPRRYKDLRFVREALIRHAEDTAK